MTDILIFSGQSNMQGQSEMLVNADPVRRASEYLFLSDKTVPLADPVGEDIRPDRSAGFSPTEENLPIWGGEHILGSACYGHSTLVPKFCESYIRKTDRDVVAVHAAKGATCIDYWLPGSVGFDILTEKSLAAIRNAAEKSEIGKVFFIWFQGESDAIAGLSRESYKEKLCVLNNALRERIGILKFGIIRVGRFTCDDRDLEIIAAQDEICAENADFLMLTAIATDLNDQPAYMHPQIHGHYSAKGLEMLGSVAGETLGKYADNL